MRSSTLLLSFLALALWPCGLSAQKANPKRDAHRPNIDLYAYRQAYTPDEKPLLRLSLYNTRRVTFTLQTLAMDSLAPDANAVKTLGKRLEKMDLSGQRTVRTWTFDAGKIYPDQWQEREIKMAPIPPGFYVLRARSNVERRVWFAVTDVALTAKRARQELLVYATQANAGQPVPNLALTAADEKGQILRGTTDAKGVWRTPITTKGGLWIRSRDAAKPALLLSGEPPKTEPYLVYLTTDRPIYRPSQTIHYKGTVKERVLPAVPNGLRWRSVANRKAQIEIRDATDALIAKKDVTTNAYGSFDGELALANEPPLGRWQIVVLLGDFRAYGNFEVQAYRKPEFSVAVTPEKPHYTGGATVPVVIEAKYYFGQPVAGATVQYQINFQPLDGDGNAAPEPPYNGTGVTDVKGQVKLAIQTKRLPFNRSLSINATVTDLSRRSQVGSGDILITAGQFRLSLSTDKTLYRPGDKLLATVKTEDYDDKPVSAMVRVRLVETKYDRNRRPYRETTTHDVETDSKGQGTVAFALPRPGYLELSAQAFDKEDNKIQTGQQYIWVQGGDASNYEYPELDIVTERTDFRPGETATLLLNTSLVAAANAPKVNAEGQRTYKQAWALVVVEGEKIYAHQVVLLTGRSTVLKIPLTAAHFPGVQVNVAILQDKQIHENSVYLTVRRDDQKLSVKITPDKARFQPGEQANYTVETRDFRNRPVPAELAFGVVDASIYALSPDTGLDLEGFFYSPQEVRVETAFSFTARYSGGAYQVVARPAGSETMKAAEKLRNGYTKMEADDIDGVPKPRTLEGKEINGNGNGKAGGRPEVRVRRLFADTAYWNSFLLTDADGRAQATFPVPDNLTTWRATGKGITLGTAVGSATQDTIATMPLQVRLELPRFLISGDELTVPALVRNDTGTSRTIRVQAEAEGLTLAGEKEQTVTLESGTQQRVEWKATVTGPEAVESAARIRVTIDGGDTFQDAAEQVLTVYPDGFRILTAQAERLTEANQTTRIDLTALPPHSNLTLLLSPSLAAALYDALDSLSEGADGSSETIVSAFYPNVAAVQALQKRPGSDPKRKARLDRQAIFALQKLYRYQHQDGGWNWWEFDQTDGDMTAYVLTALVEAKRAGYLADAGRIARGAGALENLLRNEREWNRRAEWLLALALAERKALEKPLEAAFANRAKMDTLSRATLTLALAKVGGRLLPMAQKLAGELEAAAKVQGTAAFWPVVGGYSWRDDDVTQTARVIRALLAVSPQSRILPGAVAWLMNARTGEAWRSARSSAEAVLALVRYVEKTGELNPEYRAVVILDAKELATLNANAPAASESKVLTLTAAELAGKTALTITKTGPGVLYLTTRIARYLPPAETQPRNNGIQTHHVYRVAAEDPSRADVIASGQEIEVEAELTTETAYRHVLLEEPIPAGCEVASADETFNPLSIRYADNIGRYVRQEIRDNRVVFHLDTLPAGRTVLTYRLRAETPGTFRILPGTATLFHFPEIGGNTAPARARIGERP